MRAVSRFIQERAELEAIEAEENDALVAARNSKWSSEAMQHLRLWRRLADRARADYYRATW